MPFVLALVACCVSSMLGGCGSAEDQPTSATSGIQFECPPLRVAEQIAGVDLDLKEGGDVVTFDGVTSKGDCQFDQVDPPNPARSGFVHGLQITILPTNCCGTVEEFVDVASSGDCSHVRVRGDEARLDCANDVGESGPLNSAEILIGRNGSEVFNLAVLGYAADGWTLQEISRIRNRLVRALASA